jgi:hypothetical protein
MFLMYLIRIVLLHADKEMKIFKTLGMESIIS